MNIKQIFQRLFRLGSRKPSLASSAMQADKSEVMQKVLTMLANTQDVELTCDDVFAALDQFTELAARGEDISKLMPLVQHHLNMCADCMEEYKVLTNIVANTA